MNNKIPIAIVLILTALTVTNPSLKSFVEYNGGYDASADNNKYVKQLRTANFLLFSTYKIRHDMYDGFATRITKNDKYYIGIAGNFIEY